MKVILLGPPGTGKGTQAQMIAKELNVAHISTGEMFRQLAAEGDAVGVKAKEEFWSKGLLVPDSIVNSLLKVRLEKQDCEKGFILDGYPRTLLQAESLLALEINGKKVEINQVINLFSDEETIVQRLSARQTCEKCSKIYGIDFPPRVEGKCDVCDGDLYRRADDEPEKIRARFREYDEKTAPLINFYESKGLLQNIDGVQKPDKVFKDIMEVLKE